MTDVMQGVRVLEVADHTFVPAASALLSDWGADVIKIEHVERGDAMRGLAAAGMAVVPKDVHVLLEHSNRGKRSLGLDLTSDDGLDILSKLAATSDVFLTNKLPMTGSSTSAAPARVGGDPTPTRARTTPSPSGPAPGSPPGPSGPSMTLSPLPRRPVSGTRSGP
jgi:hypothetical protein